ncbi:hypothetical protein QBC46DRAFT_396259 [Diplogelasinospora grovesii]|uniref:Zn(2)-C6 fungal-type domain-containing protein n=1 Tax=Diplogelasinospora grovesii TaxID=303347 RepID=A0AAN6S0H6_9PEZI|nr:hypothetical protein QBC46DRAFT_396259 [Diplogelasinospora grovesii]
MEANDGNKRPACDNCKNRKTKCNRGSPCSSCVAAELDCRVTRRAPEKRQRVLISSRYDEAMENVNRSLQEVSHTLQKLVRLSEKPRASSADYTTTFASGSHPSTISGLSEGYRGDSSFKAHVQHVTDALRDAASDLESSVAGPTLSTTLSAVQTSQDATDSEEAVCSLGTTPLSSFNVQHRELAGLKSLPPLDQVLKLLRLAQTEKQRFFMDVPVIDETEFGELCQKVYFAISDYSIWTWTIVNTGLYYLFLDLAEHNYAQVGVACSHVQANTRMLAANIEDVIQSLRLCQDPSVEACQALDLLTTYCNKSGRSTIAWSLIAAASRMCIDLGLHHLPEDLHGPDITKKRRVFWHIFIFDQGMAFTLGRTPSIHYYDVATERPSLKDLPGAPEHLYAGFLEFAFIVSEMHIQLFSAVAQRASQQTRVENAKAIASRLVQINIDSKKSLRDDPPANDMFVPASLLLDIIMHCLMTIAYRIVPCNEPSPNPLKCNESCVEAARQALSTIVRANEMFGQRYPGGWTMLLNLLFSLVPFASFVVLAGNTVASASAEDLALLSATVSAIEPIASNSVSGKKLLDVCESFHQIASLSVTRQSTIPGGPLHPTAGAPLMSDHRFEANIATQLPVGNQIVPSHGYNMAAHDWDALMSEFDLEIDAGAMASFVEPYMPFDPTL